MATASYKLQTFDTTNNRPKLKESNLLEIILKEVEVSDIASPTNYTAATDKISAHLAGIDAALATAGGTSFSDSLFAVYDNGDATKIARLEVSAITTGTTRTITMPDANVDLGKVLSAIQKDGSIAYTANQPMGGFKLTGLAAGSGAGDSVRYEQAILATGANAFSANQPMGGFKLTGLAAGSATGDSVRYEQAILITGVNAFTADQSMGSNKLTNLANGSAAADAVNKGQLDLYVPLTQKGANNGVASLDGAGKVPVSQLPNSIMEYQGMWNATTNSPSLADGAGSAGDVYRVSTAGSQNLGSGSISFDVSDYVIYNGSTWEKADTTDAVASVNGQTGIVVLNTSHISESGSLYFTDERAQDAVGGALLDTATIDLSYNDGSNQISADVIANSISEVHLTTSVAGAGLAGGNGTALSVGVDGVSTEITSDQVVVKFTESLTNADGSTAAIRDFVYLSSAGNVMRAQANGSFNLGTKFAVASAAVLTTASGLFYVRPGALIPGFSGLTVGSPMFISRSAAGGFTQSLSGFVAGEHIVQIGIAKSATVMEFAPAYIAEF